MFGRVASFKYSDSQQDGRLSRHLAISQSHLDNASVYDRSANFAFIIRYNTQRIVQSSNIVWNAAQNY